MAATPGAAAGDFLENARPTSSLRSLHYHPAVISRINKRWVLIALVAGGQLLALLVATVWLVNWLHVSLSEIVRQRVTASTMQYAEQMGLLIDEMRLTDAARGPGHDGWERLQALIERIHLPYEGILCLIDSRNGEVICHPHLRANPAIAVQRFGDVSLVSDQATLRIIEAGMAGTVQAGLGMINDEVHLVSVRDVPVMNAKLLILQPERAVLATVDQFVSQVQSIAITLMIAVVIFSTLLTVAIVRRYENRLAHTNANLEHLVEARSQSLLKSRSAVIFGLAKLAESRDDQTGQHLERIRQYVLVLAEELSRTHREIDRAMIDTLAETSSLHDIGKVGIPDSVLLHPGPLDDEQRKLIQRHPLIGGDTLLAIRKVWGNDPFLVTACEIAFAHHEKWDGSGYPFGLVGDNIPLAARIVAVADVYDALTSERVYKTMLSHEQAREIIYSASGTHFDPKVVAAFKANEAKFQEYATALSQQT